MSTFLTTREIQDLINVDRSTVYRMAEDGRLPGVKVGRQWRFPAARVAEQLGLDRPTAEPSDSRPSPSDLRHLLVPEAAQSVADLLGDLFGVMAVVTDMDGTPLTTVARQCGYYAAVADQPGAADACLKGWRQLADDVDFAPRFVPSHLGFLCARTFIRVGPQLVGMIIVGGVTPDAWPPPGELIHQVAAELDVAPQILVDVVDQTWDVGTDTQHWILAMLPQVGDLISQLASARSQLLTKLDAIAALAGPVATNDRSES